VVRSPTEWPRALVDAAGWSNACSHRTTPCGGVARAAKRGENHPPFVGHWLAMSQANEERLRAAYESAARMHGPDFDFLDPDVEWHTRADLPDSATYRGHDGVAKLFSEWLESFDDLRFDPEEFIDAGDDVVIAVLQLSGRIRGSGEEVKMPETHVWRMRDGKGVECREYPTKAEALKALGLAD
jgi:ketosteroid isomerase-like protein